MKKIFFISTLLLLVISASAQKSGEKTGALLWKISGNGLTQPSYIFGTHHLYPLSFLDSIPGVKQAFASCEQMAGELLLHDMAALTMEMQKAGMIPKDTTYQMLLSADDCRLVDEQLTAFFGTGLQTFGMFKPSMISLTYTAVFYQKTFPQTNHAEAMDLWFQNQASARKIPVIGLETVQDQIDAIFDVVSLKRQASDLVCMLKNTESMYADAHKLNRLYRSADLAGMSGMLRAAGPCPWSAEQETAINNARNERWLKKLPAIMADKSCFVAVGCMHLAGEAGLLAGLEQAGYTVEAVRK